jgi:hypothetical protein
MGFLYSDEEMKQMRADWAREHPEPPSHAEKLVALVRANPTAKVKDLAFAAGRSPAWVRRVMKQNGIVLIKPPKKPRVKAKATTLCARCNHPRGGRRAISYCLPSHCVLGTRHGHWSNVASYTCSTRHCLVEGCGCPDFVPQPEQAEKGEGKP